MLIGPQVRSCDPKSKKWNDTMPICDGDFLKLILEPFLTIFLLSYVNKEKILLTNMLTISLKLKLIKVNLMFKICNQL